MELEKYRRYSEMARGLRPAETVFRGAKVFMSRTGEFVDGDVAVADGVILGVEITEARRKSILRGSISAPVS